MALCRTEPANSSCFHPRAVASSPSSLSVGTKVFVGLKAQTRLGSSESSSPNVNARFYTAVNRRVSLGLSNKRATRARISMMPVGTPWVDTSFTRPLHTLPGH